MHRNEIKDLDLCSLMWTNGNLVSTITDYDFGDVSVKSEPIAGKEGSKLGKGNNNNPSDTLWP